MELAAPDELRSTAQRRYQVRRIACQVVVVVPAGYVLDHFHVFEGSYENCATCLLHVIYADDVDAWRPEYNVALGDDDGKCPLVVLG